MIYFTAEEIYLSILHSILYGVIFAALLSAIDCILKLSKQIPDYFSSVMVYEKIFSIPRRKRADECGIRIGKLRIFVYVIGFTIGYILLSYFSLDCVFRVYTLVLSLSFICFSKLTLGNLMIELFDRAFHLIICPLVIFLRIFIRPFRKIINKKANKITYFNQKG